jgi:Putative prokaryotic signal transducing protein
MSQGEWVIVFAGSPVEADLVKGLLEANGLTAMVRDRYIGTLAPWYVAPGGAGALKVLVRRPEEEAARQVLQAARQASAEEPDEEPST